MWLLLEALVRTACQVFRHDINDSKFCLIIGHLVLGVYGRVLPTLVRSGRLKPPLKLILPPPTECKKC